MTSDTGKQNAAQAALGELRPGMRLGVGTGSTVDRFIDLMADANIEPEVLVSSSEQTTQRLRGHGYQVSDLNEVAGLDLYVDGADESNHLLQLIKGGGGALTREKIVAAGSRRFVCIIDRSKLVRGLGEFPLPIEVIPMARSQIAREVSRLGGKPEWRQGFTTDNGNWILDVRGLDFSEPIRLEERINNLPGVVTVGLFARRGADLLLVGDQDGVERLGR